MRTRSPGLPAVWYPCSMAGPVCKSAYLRLSESFTRSLSVWEGNNLLFQSCQAGPAMAQMQENTRLAKPPQRKHTHVPSLQDESKSSTIFVLTSVYSFTVYHTAVRPAHVLSGASEI